MIFTLINDSYNKLKKQPGEFSRVLSFFCNDNGYEVRLSILFDDKPSVHISKLFSLNELSYINLSENDLVNITVEEHLRDLRYKLNAQNTF